MSPETPSKPTKLCPTCGTRVAEDSARCLVCGSDMAGGEKPSRASKAVQGSRMPVLSLSLPAAMGFLTLFLSIGAGLVFFALRETGRVVDPTETPTITVTVTPSSTPTPLTPTPTETPLPTPTPIAYTIQEGDTCGGIAGAFGVSILSIVQLNSLPADCSPLFPGNELLIPQPTATQTPLPTATLSEAEATEQACERVDYTVQDNDTLSSISQAYGVSMAVIKEYNGLPGDDVFLGQPLTIPLCLRNPTPGPTPTATPPPPYPAPNLLLPPDAMIISQPDEAVSLQWASVGTLAENERYAVTVVDMTEGENRKLVDYVTDTKFIVPRTFRSNAAHIYGWSVMAVRQAGTAADGSPVWEPAGAASEQRVFYWPASPASTPAP